MKKDFMNDLKKIVRFIRVAYNKLNRTINKFYAVELCLKYGNKDNIAAWCSYNIVYMDVLEILKDRKYFSIEAYFKNYIIYLLLHELSHIAQILDLNNYNKNRIYEKKIEAGNNVNVIRFALTNNDELNKLIKDFDLDILLFIIFGHTYGLKHNYEIESFLEKYKSVYKSYQTREDMMISKYTILCDDINRKRLTNLVKDKLREGHTIMLGYAKSNTKDPTTEIETSIKVFENGKIVDYENFIMMINVIVEKINDNNDNEQVSLSITKNQHNKRYYIIYKV